MSVAVPSAAVRFTTCGASNAPLAPFGPCCDSEHIGAARSSWRMPRSGGRDGFDFSFLTNRDDSQGFIAEEDRVNCPFYFKIGACRNGDRCNRAHSKPTSGNTILIPHLYPCIPEAMAVANDDEWDDETYARQQEHLEHFYEEVFLELAKFGEAMVALCEDAEYRGQLSAWLQKKKSGTSAFRMREYNKRFFTLDFDTHTFFYAHSEGSSKVSAVTPFADIVDVRMPEADLKGDNISEFSKGSKRGALSFGDAGVLALQAEGLGCSSATEASTWFEALKTAIAMDREQATEAGHTTASRRSVSQPSALAPANGGLAETQLPSTAVRGGQGRGQSKGLCPGHNAVAQPVKKLKAQGTVCMSAFRQFPVRFPADAPLPRELAFLTKVRTLRRRKQAAPHLLRWSESSLHIYESRASGRSLQWHPPRRLLGRPLCFLRRLPGVHSR
eukprot:s492_g20.t1